jgi:hypothetical protein
MLHESSSTVAWIGAIEPHLRDARSPVVNDLPGFAGSEGGGGQAPLSIEAEQGPLTEGQCVPV